MSTPSKDAGGGGLLSLFGKKAAGPQRQAEAGLPLHTAIYAHDKSALKKLIEKENPEKADSEGRNALHAAVLEQNADFVSILLKKKFPYDATDKHKMTPLLLAAELGDVKCIEALLKVCSIDAKDAKGNNVRTTGRAEPISPTLAFLMHIFRSCTFCSARTTKI